MFIDKDFSLEYLWSRNFFKDEFFVRQTYSENSKMDTMDISNELVVNPK